ncbi:glycosyltransferase family 2 protein [Oryzobacter telluris]|uniref:glycosyltransferase family 2 protein n=1 Tax=Oryzobacter telluris TaxID=3149179 RepID=UPI00370D1F65
MAAESEPARAGRPLLVPPRTLVVVPALNEAASVGSVVRAVHEHAPGADVLVVDDHSGDDTAAVARATGATVVTLPFTLGVGGAMRTGYGYALRHGYRIVVQVDGDGQHDVRDLPRLVEALRGADVVIGARFADDTPYEVGGARRFAMRILAAVMSLIVGTRLTDSTSGYRALGPRAIRLFAEHYPAEYLGDTVEALVIARKCGLVVRQVPVRMTAREHGRPTQGVVGSVVYLARALVAIGLGLVRRWTCPPAPEAVS